MTVDIGIPTYRRPESLCRAIESALAERDRGVAGRIFVVNNDPSERLSGLAGRYPVEVFDNPTNLGPTGNWNRTIELARAPYLIILHDDDELLPGRIEHGAALLDRAPRASMAFCAVEIMDTQGAVTRLFRPFGEGRSFDGATGALELLDRFVPVRAPGIMFRLAPLRAAAGFSHACAELGDIELYLKLALRSGVVYDSRLGARYRFDTGNLTHGVMFRPRDLELFEVVRRCLEPESEAARADPARWNAALDRMVARHALLSALYRLKCVDRQTALACLQPILRGDYRGAGPYRPAAFLLRAMASTPGASRLYDLARALQRATHHLQRPRPARR